MFTVHYVVNSIFDSRTYILREERSDYVWLVDCGDMDKILAKIGSKTIQGVLLTHVHFDHIYGLNELLERFPSACVYTNAWGVGALANEKLNMSRYHESPFFVVSDRVCECREGSTISLFDDVNASIYHTPGHNPSCLTFLIGNCLFTGDAFIPGIRVVTTLPHADKWQATQSLQRILVMARGKEIYPGHESPQL